MLTVTPPLALPSASRDNARDGESKESGRPVWLVLWVGAAGLEA